jgi:preprotein translocase subunit SecD
MNAIAKGLWLYLGVLCLGLSGCGGCGGSPTLTRNGGYVLTYRAPENVKHDRAAMVAAVEGRLRGFAIRPAIVTADDGNYVIELPGADDAKLAEVRRIVGSTGQLEIQIVAERGVHDAQIEAAESGEASADSDQPWRWVRLDPRFEPDPKLVTRPRDGGGEDVLMVTNENDVSGNDLTSVSAGRDSTLRPCLDGEISSEAAVRMRKLSGDNIHRKLGIVFDGSLLTAPVIQSPVDARFQITGQFTEEEVQLIIGVLKAGSLPAPLVEVPDSVKKVEPQ